MDARRNARTVRVAAVLAALVLPGCYTYVPIDRPDPGTEVRVRVPVRSSVGSSDGRTDMVPFEGTVVSFGDSLLLETRTTMFGTGHRELVSTDTVHVLAGEMTNLEERVLSKGRTAGLTVAVVGGAVLGAMAISGLAGSGGGEKPGNGGQASLRPEGLSTTGWRLLGIRIPIPWPSG